MFFALDYNNCVKSDDILKPFSILGALTSLLSIVMELAMLLHSNIGKILNRHSTLF